MKIRKKSLIRPFWSHCLTMGPKSEINALVTFRLHNLNKVLSDDWRVCLSSAYHHHGPAGAFPQVILYQGCQACLQIGSDWPQIGQMRNFFRSDFSTFLLNSEPTPKSLFTTSTHLRLCSILGLIFSLITYTHLALAQRISILVPLKVSLKMWFYADWTSVVMP